MTSSHTPTEKAEWLLDRSAYALGQAEAMVLKCAQEAAEAGDSAGVRYWEEVLDAIETLRWLRGRGEMVVH